MSTPSDLSQRPSRREHLLKRSHLVLLALGLLLVLALLAPTSSSLVGTLGRPDSLSLQYLRLLIAVQPNDVALKLRLAQTLLALGRLDEAGKLVDSLPRTDPRLGPVITRLAMQIHLAQYAQDPARAAREKQLVAQLVKEVEGQLDQPLSAEELLGLAASSLSIGQPELAGRVYLRLAVVDPKQRRRWLSEAAKQELASGQPAAAGVLYDQLAQGESDPQARRRYALLALEALTSANLGDKALAFAKRYLEQFPDDPELLAAAAKLALANGHPAVAANYYDTLVRVVKDPAERLRYAKLALLALGAANKAELSVLTAGRYLQLFPGDVELLAAATRLALATQKPRLAKDWGRALLAKHPTDGTLLANQLDIELAAGDPVAALELGQRLVARHPGNLKQREKLAQLALWNNRPDLALAQLAYLALHGGDRKHLEQALKMAPQLYELEILADLLAVKARHGRLTNTELASLVETFENVARPEELVQILKEYLGHYPDHREAWEALAEVHERRGDLEGALATFEKISRDFGSSIKEVTHRAELLWQLHQPGKAYVLLRDALDHAGIATTAGLLTRAELTTGPGGTELQLVAPSQKPVAVPDKGRDKEQTKEEKKLEEDRKSFLKLLAELVWQSEPRPESLEEYRLLWAKGALVRESVERYVLLAEARGQADEAIGVSVDAYRRFKDPEFLLGAMDIAVKLRRFPDMEHLIDIAERNEELFKNSKRYYLTLADYYSQQKDYDRAQRAYLRVVALDPRTVAARADVLWLLIDHSDDRARLRGKHNRAALARLLTDWEPIARHEPALWLPFATGWSMLGRTKQAIAYYQREWTQRPTDHLWLLGYISTLDAVSRNSDALILRRFALSQLRPEVLQAAHRGSSPAEREKLKAYAELVRDAYGPGKGSRWMAGVLRADLEPAVQKGLLATWRSDGDNAAPYSWVTDSRTVTRTNPWGRYPKAVKPGQLQQQPTLADAGSAPDEEAEPPPAPLRVLDQDATAGEDQVPDNAQIVSVSAGIQTVNDLAILNTSVSALVARGIWALGGHLGVNQLFLNGADDPQAVATEVDLAAFGQWRHRLGRFEVGVGANLRADANLWSGWAKETFKLWQSGTLQLGLQLNELATDSRWLRIYGARHRLTVGLSTSFASDGILNVQGNFYHYHTRTNEEIGAGGNVDLELGYRIRRVRPLWTVRASGSYTRNFLLTDQAPEFGRSSSSAAALIDTLPLEFAAAGVGTRVEHRFPGVAPIGAGRWRYFADAWVGWLWPVNLVGFEMSAGASLALPRRQELSIKGFVANNRWLGPGVLNAGVNLSYLFR
jgi:tetratricopeptide (TPR) repeat protein